MGCCSLTLCCVLLLVPRLVSVAILWFALPVVGYALLLPVVGLALLLPAVGFALLLPAVGFALLGSFHRFSPSRRLSAALRAHRRFDVLLAVLVPVLLHLVLLFTTDSLAVVPSLLPPASLCGSLHLPGCLACTSNTTTQHCALRDRWLAVGARAPRSCSLQQRVLLTVRTGLRGSLPLRSVGGFKHH